jgi:hypothetical protein
MKISSTISCAAAIAAALFLTASCAKIYDLSIESLRDQVSKASPVTRPVANDHNLVYAYSHERETNGLDSLVCTSGKKKTPITVHLNPNMTMEVTDTAKTPAKTMFYLDSVFCNDSTLVGQQSQILKEQTAIKYGTIKTLKVNASHKGDLKYSK